MTVRRYDQSEPISSVTTTPSGGRRLGANLSRVGVFEYQYADGSKVREYRPPEEVLQPESIASFVGAPVTDLHPEDMVSPENFAAVSKGHVLAADGKPPYVVGTIDVNDGDLISKIDNGDRKEVSMGYTADFDPTPGRTPDGEAYDGVQRNIRGNHAAIGPTGWGRQGPTVALRLDSNSAMASCMTVATTSQVQTQPRATIMKIRVDGIECEVGDATHISLLEKQHATASKRADDAVALVATEKARADAATKLAADEKLRADTAEALIAPKAIAKRVAERVNLITIARKALGPQYLVDAAGDEPGAAMAAASDDDIITAALIKMSPGFSAKGMGHDQLMGALAYACSTAASTTDDDDGYDQDPGGEPMDDGFFDPQISPDPEFKGGSINGTGIASPSQKGPMGFDSKTAARGKIGQKVRNPNITDADDEEAPKTQEQVLKEKQRARADSWKDPLPGAATKAGAPVANRSRH